VTRKQRILVGLAIVIALPLVGSVFIKRTKANRAAAEEAAQHETPIAVEALVASRGRVEQIFTLTGTIEADAQSRVVPKIPGKISRVAVREGQQVRKGQVLVELERGDLETQLRQARAGVAAAEARLKQARAGTGLQRTQTSTGIETAEAALASARTRLAQAETAAGLTRAETSTSIERAREAHRAAQARLDMVIEGARTQQVSQADEGVRQAKAALDNATANLKRAEQLLSQGAMAEQQYEAAKLQYDVAQAQYNTAAQQRDLVREGARSQEVEMARADVEQARAALSMAEAAQDQNRIRQQDVQAAREQVRTAQAALDMAKASVTRDYMSEEDVQAATAALNQAAANVAYVQTQIGYTYVRAPMDGVVTQCDVDPGEGATPGVPLLTITNNSSVYIRAQLPETEMGNAEVGQQATVTVDALSGRELFGDVIEIIPAADTTSRSFDMKVALANPDGKLKQGMFARITLVTAEADNAVVIPRDAVVDLGGQPSVFVVDGSKAAARAVTTGIHDRENVVVSSGVIEGDRIVVQGQHLLRDGQMISVSTARGADL